jgi:hypothetical protein
VQSELMIRIRLMRSPEECRNDSNGAG